MTRTPPSRPVVAAEVRAAMARANINATKLAQAIDMSVSTLSDRLNSKRAFNTDELHAIAEYLGVDVFSLMAPPSLPERAS